jgi:hypothetical protein
MGFVFQFYNLMPVLSAVENVELPLLIARVPTKRARRMALEALDMVGLGERLRICRRSCQVVSASEPRSPARWSTTRQSCGRMSPPATSIASTQPRSSP